MPWLTILILFTLLVLCWGGGWGIYRSGPAGFIPGTLCGLLGLIILIVLVLAFLGNLGPGRL